MSITTSSARSAMPASYMLGQKLDSIPFSAYHMMIILVLGAVGFVEGYDLALGGSLLVLAKVPLHLAGTQIRWLAVAPTLLVVAGRLHRLRDVRPHQPQDGDADRRGHQHRLDLADPAGADRRATDRHPRC